MRTGVLKPMPTWKNCTSSLAVEVFPQRMIGVITNGVEVLRSHGRQCRRQHLPGVLVRVAGQLSGLVLEPVEVEGLGIAIGCTSRGPGLGGQQAAGREPGVGSDGHGRFEQIPAVHNTTCCEQSRAFPGTCRIEKNGSDMPSAKRNGHLTDAK